MNDIQKISEVFCFIANNVTILQSQKALRAYSEKLDAAANLEKDIPIFLDTNVLLDYYKISFSEREELQRFFEFNKERIYLTNQIEKEFLTHRIDHIKSYLKSLEEFVNAYKNIKSEIEKLKQGEIKGLEPYLNNNILKNDYQDLRNELVSFNNTIKGKLKLIFEDTDFEQQIIEKEKKIEEIKKRLEGQADIERNDPLLDLIASFKITSPLDEEEITFLKDRYEQLAEVYTQVKGDQNLNWKHTFPGCGEKKDFPYGDFYIYHEILKFMKAEDVDIVFLTNDVEKNDWLLRNKAELLPYTHYIVNTFIATGHTMYIFQAKDKMRVSYEAIYIEEQTEQVLQIPEKDFEGKVTLIGPKVIGKIDLQEYQGGIGMGLNMSEYTDITEMEFVSELYQSQDWARTYGDNFVGLRSFIVKYLGGKGYGYKMSFTIKDILVSKGLIEIYMHVPQNADYNDVEAVRLTSEGVELAQSLKY